MSDPSGQLSVEELGIANNWSVVGTNNSLMFVHNGHIKKVVPIQTSGYFFYNSQYYSVLSQSSYYEDSGTGVSLFIKARFIWNTDIQVLTVLLPTGVAKNKNIGCVIVSWEEEGKLFSTSMGTCYINDDRTAVLVESTIFSPNRIIHIDAAITYHTDISQR
jgi:hypothetical protein